MCLEAESNAVTKVDEENKRLREALERIVEIGVYEGQDNYTASLRIATKALERKDDDKI